MTRHHVGPLSTGDALLSHVADAARLLLLAVPPGRRTPRDLAFSRYLRQVRRILRSDPSEFEVVESRMLARGTGTNIVEVTLGTTATVVPGDMLHVLWRNASDRIVRHAPHLAAGAYWSTPLPHRPARRLHYSAEEVAASLVDLSHADVPVSPRRLPRITPRFFTVAGVRQESGQTLVRLQVTRIGTWPERAAAFLHDLRPGERMQARVLPHPHRVPLDSPGCAIVTGSGAAGVFAALRTGARGVQLLWGIGDKVLEPWVREELDAHLASGALASLHLAQAPERVTGLLDRIEELPGWIYVSGNSHMGRDVDVLLSERFGRAELRTREAHLRYIVST